MGYYVMNRETQKLELHFSKEEYMELPEELKKGVRSNFLFSKKSGSWVSRAKFPNLWRAEAVVEKLGLEDGGKVGENLTFAEQMERKAERAEKRAERYEHKADMAVQKGEILQKPIKDMHGDIAFFTQPNINSSAGRVFTRRREKMFSAWERGFEEFKKSEYYAERAETARQTAEQTRPTDKGFIDRRIKDAEKTIRAQKKNLQSYYEKLKRIEQGEEIQRYGGGTITAETVKGWIETAEQIIENAISKSIYYHECLEAVGGVVFSQENIKTGYIVDLDRWGRCKVMGTGKVNISYEIMDGGAAGMGGKAAYAEIKSILSDKALPIDVHPFKVGEVYTVKAWNGEQYGDKEYTVIKVTEEKVTLKSGTDRAITKKPRKFRNGSSPNGYSWALGITNGLYGTVYKNDAE